ncbi:hypothetical protein L0990_09595 [Vibrio kanaloae]|uniref:hypothetical protein n=1 Tax=Vibrio kanaloae TaxID=170673 RepID=UPI0035A6E389
MIESFVKELQQAGVYLCSQTGHIYHGQADLSLPTEWLQDLFTEQYPSLNWYNYKDLILKELSQ